MRTPRPEPHTLAGAYALDALTGPDRARFEHHLDRCPQCAGEITGLREITARLAAAAATEPPAGLIARAAAAATQTRQLPPVTPHRSPRWPTRHRAAAPSTPAGGRARSPRRALVAGLVLALAGAVVVLATVLGLGARSAPQQLPHDQLHASQLAAVLTARDAHMISSPVSGGGTATVVMSPREHALVFAAAGLPALPPSRCYQLWLMGPAGDRPAGMLPEPRRGMTGPVLATGLQRGDRLGLTIEPAGGSADPTAPVIALIPL